MAATTGAGGRLSLARALADGQPESATALARLSGLDVSEVPAAIDGLSELGLEVLQDGDAYRLSDAVELLDAEYLASQLGATPSPELQVLQEVDSTNTVVRDLPLQAGATAVCFAEFQHAGRGRLDRRWLVPFGAGLCFSVAWQAQCPVGRLGGLSLAVGVALRRALAACGVAGVRLKWPNDLLLDGAKLGGVLVEVLSPQANAARVVVGVGINWQLSAGAREAVRRCGGQPAAVSDVAIRVGRNTMAAALVDAVIDVLQQFESHGLAAFRDEWLAADAMRDLPVRVSIGTDSVHGVARGIDHSGALAVDVMGQRRFFSGGEVSLRRAGDAAD